MNLRGFCLDCRKEVNVAPAVHPYKKIHCTQFMADNCKVIVYCENCNSRTMSVAFGKLITEGRNKS